VTLNIETLIKSKTSTFSIEFSDLEDLGVSKSHHSEKQWRFAELFWVLQHVRNLFRVSYNSSKTKKGFLQ